MRIADTSPLLLLDTHIWIWALNGVRGALSASSIAMLNQASAHGGLLVSAISVWEVAVLSSKRRISLAQPIDAWVSAGLSAPGIRLVPLTPEIAIDSTRLPGVTHGDPADRIIIATARRMAATLVTSDRAILDYANAGHLQVISGMGEER